MRWPRNKTERMLACKMRKAIGKLLPDTLERLGDVTSGSANAPSLDEFILNAVRKLGRLPRELRNKHRGLIDEEKFERLLAERVRRNRDKLLPATRKYLIRLSTSCADSPADGLHGGGGDDCSPPSRRRRLRQLSSTTREARRVIETLEVYGDGA